MQEMYVCIKGAPDSWRRRWPQITFPVTGQIYTFRSEFIAYHTPTKTNVSVVLLNEIINTKKIWNRSVGWSEPFFPRAAFSPVKKTDISSLVSLTKTKELTDA